MFVKGMKKPKNAYKFPKGHKFGIGKKCSKETKKKMSETHKRIDSAKWLPHLKGEKHPMWKGGNTKLRKLEKLAGKKKPEQCEICGAFGKICYDHDHKTGKFRGWICYRCNVILGFAKDSPDLLNALIEYLKNNERRI